MAGESQSTTTELLRETPPGLVANSKPQQDAIVTSIWLWVPHVTIGVGFVVIMVISFLRFHIVNRERYKQREIRRRSTLHHMTKQRSIIYHIKLPQPSFDLSAAEFASSQARRPDSNLGQDGPRSAWKRAVKLVRGEPARSTANVKRGRYASASKQSSTSSFAETVLGRQKYVNSNVFLGLVSTRTPSDTSPPPTSEFTFSDSNFNNYYP